MWSCIFGLCLFEGIFSEIWCVTHTIQFLYFHSSQYYSWKTEVSCSIFSLSLELQFQYEQSILSVKYTILNYVALCTWIILEKWKIHVYVEFSRSQISRAIIQLGHLVNKNYLQLWLLGHFSQIIKLRIFLWSLLNWKRLCKSMNTLSELYSQVESARLSRMHRL